MKSSSIALLILSIFTSCDKTPNHHLIITNVNIVDVKTGEILLNRTVAIDNTLITAIYEKDVAVSDSTIVINGSSKFLIPGLWDMHAHYYDNHLDSDPLLIANGVVGVREMWGNMSVINEVRRKTLSGEIIAPDIYTSGTLIDGSPQTWPGSAVVSSPEEVKAVVNQQIADGVDFLKIYNHLTFECFMALADLVNSKNIPFAGHIPYEISIYQAIEAGMASSEHLIGFLLACSSKEDSLRTLPINERLISLINTFSENKFDSLCEVLAQSEMWLCPTLIVNQALCYLNDTSFRNDERLAYLPEYITFDWDPANNFLLKDEEEEDYQLWRNRFHFELELIGRMNEKGVKILAGTDYPNPYCFPGFSLHDELSLMVAGGMSELEALNTATINAAVFMNKDDEFGTVEVGKLASLVLLNNNPVDNIENTKSIETVILRGKVFDRTTLDEMLDLAKINAALTPLSKWLRIKILTSGIEKALDSLDILISTESRQYKLSEYDITMLGYDYLYGGETEIAVNIFEKNIDLFPESSNAYDSYAESLYKNGQYGLAIENYNKSLEIDPGNSNARMMLDSIENTKTKLQIQTK